MQVPRSRRTTLRLDTCIDGWPESWARRAADARVGSVRAGAVGGAARAQVRWMGSGRADCVRPGVVSGCASSVVPVPNGSRLVRMRGIVLRVGCGAWRVGDGRCGTGVSETGVDVVTQKHMERHQGVPVTSKKRQSPNEPIYSSPINPFYSTPKRLPPN